MYISEVNNTRRANYARPYMELLIQRQNSCTGPSIQIKGNNKVDLYCGSCLGVGPRRINKN